MCIFSHYLERRADLFKNYSNYHIIFREIPFCEMGKVTGELVGCIWESIGTKRTLKEDSTILQTKEGKTNKVCVSITTFCHCLVIFYSELF